jgi:hypothetical protein
LAAFAFGNAVTAIVPSFPLVLMSRVIAAAGTGLFTADASATAALFSGGQNCGQANALVMLGPRGSIEIRHNVLTDFRDLDRIVNLDATSACNDPQPASRRASPSRSARP